MRTWDMRVINRKILEDFGKKHTQAKKNLDAWYKVVKDAAWRSLIEVRRVYPTADFVDELTVFNISGNNYRLITRINYRTQTVFIERVLTHAEYSKERWKP
jgi:mRNA interferase HigB